MLGGLTVVNSASFLFIPYLFKGSQVIGKSPPNDSNRKTKETKEEDKKESKDDKEVQSFSFNSEFLSSVQKKFLASISSFSLEQRYLLFFSSSFCFLFFLGKVSKFRTLYARKLQDLFARQIRSQIFYAVFSSKRRTFDPAVLVQKSINDVQIVSESLANIFFGMIRGTVIGVGGLAAILYYFPNLAVLTSLYIIAFGLKGKQYNNLIQQAAKEQISFLENISSQLGHIGEKNKTVFLAKGEKFFDGFFQRDLEINHDKVLNIAKLRGKYIMFIETFGIGYILSIICYGTYLVSVGSLAPENLALSIFAIYAAIGLRSVNFNLNELKEKMGILESLEEFFQAELIKRSFLTKPAAEFGYYIEFEQFLRNSGSIVEREISSESIMNLEEKKEDFLLKQRNPTDVVINKLHIINRGLKEDVSSEIYIEDLTIAKNSFKAIEGKSGIGKTTIFNIINGFREAQKGNVDFVKEDNDREVRNFYFTQNPEVFPHNFIFNIMIANLELVNYVMSLEGFSKEDKFLVLFKEIKRSLMKANLWEKALSVGLTSSVENLSGGEKQRLVFARMFFSNADVLYMDESMASLDIITYRKIVGELKKFGLNRTILFISHDKQLVEDLCGDNRYEVTSKNN